MAQQTLTPAPADLGIASCGLGPWFNPTLTLPAPSGTSLALPLSIAANTDWLPPVSGLLGFYIASGTLPLAIAPLRDPAGAMPFANGAVVALFRILSEAEERLHQLMRFVPLPTAQPLASSVDFQNLTAESEPTRARVRSLALEIAPASDGTTTLNNLVNLLSPAVPATLTTAADKATYIGLKLDGTTLSNGPYDVADLKRAGQFTFESTPRRDVLLHFAAAASVKLHAFDAAGRALDPGAVACWWRFLTTAFSNLWAKGITSSSDQHIVDVASGDKLLAQIVNAHEGPPSGPIFDSRLSVTNATPSTGTLRTRSSTSSGSGSASMTFSFSAAPSSGANNAPIPRLALLPKGTYGSTLSLWPGGALHTTLTRDHVRVALVDVELHVAGVPRLSTAATGTPERRRADFQAKESLRIRVQKLANAASGDLFGPLATTEQTNRALLDVFGGTGAATLLTSVAERDFGVIDATASTGTPIDSLPDFTVPAGATPVTHDGRTVGAVRAVNGAGQTAGPTVTGQRVAIDLSLGTAHDAFVRAWPQGLNHQTGIHFRQNGASARGRAIDNAVTILLPLPDGAADPAAQIGFDILIVTPTGTRFFADLRFPRPPVGSAAMLSATGTGPITLSGFSGDVLICETGEVISPINLAGRVPPGASILGRSGGTYTLVDRGTLPKEAFISATLARTLASGDTVLLTERAFNTQPQGDDVPAFATTGATVTVNSRHDGLSLPGTPLASMERLEVVASRVTSSDARAAVGTGRSLGSAHELLPNASGHPGAPATVETHGTGVALTGAAAVAVSEVTRDRAKWFLPDLFVDAITPLPSLTSNESTVWAAPLRTTASDVDDPLFANAVVQMPQLFPFGDILPDIEHWIQNRHIPAQTGASSAVTTVIDQINNALSSFSTPSAVADPAKSVARALDRRMIASAYGLKETAVSLKAAFERAEDFVYIETPALDLRPTREADGTGAVLETLDTMGALVSRLAARPGLRLLVCVPVHHMSEVSQVANARDILLLDAIESFRGATNAASRVVVFSPASGPGRTLRLSATTVIVDDAFLVTGSTHLSRRGRSFDGSLAVSMFDETVTGGRPSSIRSFRRTLVANRLGVDSTLVPEDPIGLLEAVHLFVQRGGGTRLALASIERPETALTETDFDIRNPDGSPNPTLRVLAWVTKLGDLSATAIDVPAP